MALNENKIFGDSFVLLFKDRLILVLALLLTAIDVIFQFVTDSFNISNSFYTGIYAMLLLVILALFSVFVYGIVFFRLGGGKNLKLSDLAKMSASRYLSILATFVLTGLIVGLGTMFFVIPGIYLFVRLFIAPVSAARDKKNPLDALSKSWSMTKGQGWPIFIITLLVGIILLIIDVGASIAGISFISTFFGFAMVIASVLIYNGLSRKKIASVKRTRHASR